MNKNRFNRLGSDQLFFGRLGKFSDEKIIDCYESVFMGEPWNEWKKCTDCGINYGLDEFKEMVGSTTNVNLNCKNDDCSSEVLETDSFYKGGDQLGQKILSAARREEGLLDLTAYVVSERACAEDRLVGFLWGYKFPSNDSPSVMFSKAQDMLVSNGFDLNTTLYLAETGVVPGYRGQGIGQSLLSEMKYQMVSQGLTGMVMRTVNPQMVRNANSRVGSVQELGIDPNPMKSSIWYGVKI